MNLSPKSMRLLRVDEILAGLLMPQVYPAQSITFTSEDALIVCAGFEDRSLGVLQSLSPGIQPRTLLLEYRPHLIGNRLEECLAECYRLGIVPLRYVYDRESPSGAGLDIWSQLEDVSGRVYIDLSGMSRLLIVQLIGTSTARGPLPAMTVLYTEPAQYFPLREQVDAVRAKETSVPIDFLSWGVSEITVVPELSSVALPDQPTHLIAFPSFDNQQLAAVCKDVEPTRISMIFGKPLAAHGEWRLDAVRDLNRRTSGRNLAEFVTSTYDYRETLSILLQLYSRGQRLEKIVISPTGSKMQTVAVGIFRAFLTDTKVVYPTPRTFATKAYTVGIGGVHKLVLDAFGSIGNLGDRPVENPREFPR